MGTKAAWVAAIGLSGIVVSAPALANGFGGGCGARDSNACQMSPTAHKACAKDLRRDIKELLCDIKELVRDVRKGRTDEIAFDKAEIRSDLKEIRFDVNVLASLSPKKKR